MVAEPVVAGDGRGPRSAAVASLLRRLADDRRVRTGANAVAALLALYWVQQRLWPAPVGVLVRGLIIGSLTAMVAFGLSLVYRANRIVNFAQGDLGGVPATLAVLLMVAEGVPYVVAVATGVVAGAALGGLVEIMVIRWFAKAPRLILTVATIGLSQLLAFGEVGLPTAFNVRTPPQNIPAPFSLTFGIGPILFNANSVVAIIVVPLVLAGIWAFFRFSSVGVAVRASAERSDRAALLGVPVKRLNTLVWVLAATLATVGLILRAGVVGLPFGSTLGISILVQALAAAVIARMDRLWVMFLVALGVGVIEQAVVWHTGNELLVDPILFGVILVALLVQRGRALTRLQDAAVSSWRAVHEVGRIPHELRDLPEVRWVVRGVRAVLALVAVGAPPLIGEGRTDLAAGLLVFGIVAVSLVVLTGWSGQVSLGQFAFVGLGAAVGGWVTVHLQWDILASLAVAGLAGAVASMVIGIPALRIRGLFLAVATLAFAQAAYSYFLNSNYVHAVPSGDTYIPRRPLLSHIDISTETRYYYFCLAVFVLTVVGVTRLRRSHTGRLLVAVRENERGVQSYGLNLTTSKLTAFAVSGFLAAMAGALYVHLQTGFLDTSFTPEQSLSVFVMAVIGGLGSLTGAVLGAVYIQSLTWFRSAFPTGLQNFMPFLGGGAGLVLILMFLPGGLGSLVFAARDRWLRWVARRRGILVPSLVADLRLPEPQLSEDPYPSDAAAATTGSPS